MDRDSKWWFVLVAASVSLNWLASPVPAAAPDPASARSPEHRYAAVLLRDVPHVRQKPDFCGEACAEMYLRKLGAKIDQDQVFEASGLDPVLGRGCYTAELSQALSTLGFRPGNAWSKIQVAHAAGELESHWARLHAALLRGVPSIVCMRFDQRPNTTEHFRLVLGYEPRTDEVIYHDPAEENGAYLRMKRAEFLELWPLKYASNEWTLIRLPLDADRVKPPAARAGFSPADYCQHILRLKERLPDKDFQVLIEPPFVVVGDEPPATLKRRSTDTIQWAVRKLKQEYFSKDPDRVIDIWLFKDKESYEANVVKLWGTKPSTPYGYYSAAHQALVMNISTGGGTLVHEIVHPFVRTNFPQCPDWLNEGLGSLYEQCGDAGGRIHGYTNWRLAGLQKAIRADRVPSFEDLCGTTGGDFYTADPGTNYSQARYLCYYLQEHGLLKKFYHDFQANCREDPTGYPTLKRTLGRDDMAEFEKEWRAYVMNLEFP